MFEDIIIKHLNRVYKASVLTEAKIEDLYFIDINTKRVYNENKLNLLLCEIFEYDYHLIKKILDDWAYKVLDKFSDRFIYFLNNCELKLGQTSWLVYNKEYGIINKDLDKLNLFDNIDSDKLYAIKFLFKKWYEEKIIETTEKLIKNL